MNHTVDVLTYHEGEPIDVPGVTLHRIAKPLLVKNVPIGPSWQKLVCDASMALKLRRMIRENCYDLIHAVEESAFLADLSGLPFVFDMDSLMSRQIVEKSKLFWPAAMVVAWLERQALRHCVGVLAVCPAVADIAKKYQPNVQLQPDVAIEGNGPGTLPAVITEAKGLRFMYVGNLETYQGVDLMLEAFAVATKARPDAVLIIVGGTTDRVNYYRRKAAGLGLREQVKFSPSTPVECLGRVLSFADILLSPRIQGNNTPMKLYSYLLSGRPIIATRLATHTQAVTDEHVLLVDPTAAAMAAGMHRLMDSPELRKKLGAAGRELATQCYSLTAFRQRLASFYRRITNENLDNRRDRIHRVIPDGATRRGRPQRRWIG